MEHRLADIALNWEDASHMHRFIAEDGIETPSLQASISNVKPGPRPQSFCKYVSKSTPMAYVPGPSAGTIAAATAPTFTDAFNNAVAAPYGYHSIDLPAAVARINDHAPSAAVNAVPTNGTAEHRPNFIENHRDFGRQSKLDRHMKIHQPDVEMFQCQVAEGLYSSIREDKWLEHVRRRYQPGGVAPMFY